MAHFNFVISQNAKWGHAGFYIDCHRMTVPENIFLQKSTGYYRPCYKESIAIGRVRLFPLYLLNQLIFGLYC